MSDLNYEFDSDVITDQNIDIKEPKSYHAVLYNDNYTTIPFSPGTRAVIVKSTYWINI